MKANITVDTKTYEDFTKLYSINQLDDYTVAVSLKHNDDTVYSLTGFTTTCKLRFINTLKEGETFDITGSVTTASSGLLSFDFKNIFTTKGGNVYKVNLVMALTAGADTRDYIVKMGKLIVVT